MINFKSEQEGFYTLRLGTIDADGKEVDCYEPVPTFTNLITNSGLEQQADNGAWLRKISVGSGSSVPSVDDTALANFVASTTSTQNSVSGTQGTEPFFTWRRVTRRFSEGAAAGNLSEVGIGGDTELFSRALIRDTDGNPTTITVSAEQFLDVTYEYRFYPKLTDSTGSVTLGGSVAGTYDYIFRSSEVTSSSTFSGWSIGTTGTSMGADAGNASGSLFYDGDIGAINAGPGGLQSAASSFSRLAYSAGSLEREFRLTCSLTQGNLAGGIRSARVKMGIGTFQIQFDPPIPKTDERTLVLDFSHSWGRRA